MIIIPEIGEQHPGDTRVLFADAGTVLSRTVTAAGVRVASESMAGARSATIGVWAPVGSRDEIPELAGASHFLEHLLFKGTRKRTALDISAAIDEVGGELNAFTSKEYTCFYARVIDVDVPLAIDVLMDMALSALIDPADVDSERDVILEEIAMHDDDPADAVQQLFAAQVFADTPLADPVIGTTASISAMPADSIAAHYHQWYQPQTLVVTAAGGLDHTAVVAAVEQAVAAAQSDGASVTGQIAVADDVVCPRARRGSALTFPTQTAQERRVFRDIEQVNIMMGYRGLPRLDPLRPAAAVFNAAVGGGMSSRLFQEVREARGLAYSVQSFSTSYSDAGSFGVYAGTMPERVDTTLEVIADVLAEVRVHGLSPTEVTRGKGQIKGGLVLAMEESSTRMMTLGEAELVTGEYLSVSERLARIDAVTPGDLDEVAQRLCVGGRQLSIVGRTDDGSLSID